VGIPDPFRAAHERETGPEADARNADDVQAAVRHGRRERSGRWSARH